MPFHSFGSHLLIQIVKTHTYKVSQFLEKKLQACWISTLLDVFLPVCNRNYAEVSDITFHDGRMYVIILSSFAFHPQITWDYWNTSLSCFCIVCTFSINLGVIFLANNVLVISFSVFVINW